MVACKASQKIFKKFSKKVLTKYCTVLYNVNIASDKQTTYRRDERTMKRKVQLKKAMEWRKYWFIELGGTRSLYKTAYT